MDPHQKRDLASDVAESCLEESDKSSENSDHDFTTKTWREDFCFIVEDKRLYVAKVILALASPVFERMFQTEFKEKGEAEMTLPGKKNEEIQEFLRCIYPSVMKSVTIKNAHQIVALAEEYQVVSLKSKCEACFLSSIDETSSTEALYRFIDIASLYSLDDLFHKCTTLAAGKSVSELNQAEEKTTISPKAKNVIQREIIDKLIATQVKTNKRVDNLNKELQRVMVLNNYHCAGMPKNERLSFDAFKGWTGKSVVLKIDTSKFRKWYNPCEHSIVVDICGTYICLEFKFTDGYFRLCVSVPETEIKPFKVMLVGKVVIINGLKGNEDFCKVLKMELIGNTKSSTVTLLKEETALGNGGYTFHGEMGVEVHLLALKEKVK